MFEYFANTVHSKRFMYEENKQMTISLYSKQI